VALMHGIARLLFGREADSLDDLFAPGDGDVSGLAEQARRAGDWCGTTPPGGSVSGAGLGGDRTRREARPGAGPDDRRR
jgi:hypothetical protein